MPLCRPRRSIRTRDSPIPFRPEGHELVAAPNQQFRRSSHENTPPNRRSYWPTRRPEGGNDLGADLDAEGYRDSVRPASGKLKHFRLLAPIDQCPYAPCLSRRSNKGTHIRGWRSRPRRAKRGLDDVD